MAPMHAGKDSTPQAPSQEGALQEFGGVGPYESLNHEGRSDFRGQEGVDGEQSAALGAIAGGLSGGGKNSSEDRQGFAGDVLGVGKDSEYAWNADSPFAKQG